MAQEQDILLQTQGLRVRYHDGTEALRGVDISIRAGQRVALIGPNGAGKTSLMLAILGGAPWTGRIVVDGLEMVKGNVDEAASRCGLVFQDADDQLFMPTFLEDVAFGPLNQGLKPAAAEQQARATIAAVGLNGLEGRCAHHLSGGQKRLAALATVLAMDVKLLLLDEPGANLDHRSRRRLIDLLAGRPEAMLLATHDLAMVKRLCHHVVLLDGGLPKAAGPVEQILADGRLLGEHGLD